MDKEVLIGFWEDWVNKQESDKFILNSDMKIVDDVVVGVLKNEEDKGFKYCPCRVPIGDEKKDLALICPCNFKIQNTWKDKGECFCSLFIKSEKASLI